MGNNTSKTKKTQQTAEKTPKNENVSVKQAKLSDLIPDDKNFNRGTEFGDSLIEKSLRENGAGRSILLDKNNRIIAGNKTTEKAAVIDLNDVIIVETDGTKLVAVKRTDIDLDSEQGRNLALADNATSAANLEWDKGALKAMEQEMDNFSAEEWGVDLNIHDDSDEPPENPDGQRNNKAFVAKLTFPSDDKLQSFIKMYTDELSQQYGCTISVSGGEL